MLHTLRATRGVVTAPHHLAAQAGLAVLRDGGTAIEAAVAAHACAAVVYPHMTGLGGDGFWLIHEPGRPVLAVDASGAAGRAVTPERYRGADRMPLHGPMAAATVAGAVSGWQAALDVSKRWGGDLPLARLLEDAIHYARKGFPVSRGQAEASARMFDRLSGDPAFADVFFPQGRPPAEGMPMALPRLAESLTRLAEAGLDDFYRGRLGHEIAGGLGALGSPLASEDFARHRSVRRRPLSLSAGGATVHTTPPPTQGLATLMTLGLFERLGVTEADGVEHIHALIEAAKIAHRVRDSHITDPAHMEVHPTTYLSGHVLDRFAAEIDPKAAAPWPPADDAGDTAWIGVIDGQGRAVSVIQSLYHAFGSGVWLPEVGLLWHNRAAGFSLDLESRNLLAPGKKTMHTLAPALAKFDDGRILSFGTMGGLGQPQTLAEVFTRYAHFGQGLQQAVTAPRWALGRGFDGPADDVKIEDRVPDGVLAALKRRGHPVTRAAAFDTLMGHAGAALRRPDGVLEAAADPRSDGVVAGF